MRILVALLLAGAVHGQRLMDDPAEAEKALRQRVQEFYQLQVAKKFRQAEEYVAADTKDEFYNAGKPELAAFSIEKVVLKGGTTRAEVTVKGKVGIFVMGQGMVNMELPTTGTWKVEDGKWVMYIDHSRGVPTPFGNMQPAAGGAAAPVVPATPDFSAQVKNFDVNSLKTQVRAEPSAVSLTKDQPVQAVTITNGMTGAVDLTLLTKTLPGIEIALEKTHLGAGEKAKLTFTRKGDTSSSGSVRLEVSPTGVPVDVGVSSK